MISPGKYLSKSAKKHGTVKRVQPNQNSRHSMVTQSDLEVPDSGDDSSVAELLLMLSTIRDHLLLPFRTQVNLR